MILVDTPHYRCYQSVRMKKQQYPKWPYGRSRLILVGLIMIGTYASALASWNLSPQQPAIYLLNPHGQVAVIFDAAAIQNIKQSPYSNLYSPSDLMNACFVGRPEQVVTDILLDPIFLQASGNYSECIEAQAQPEKNTIHYQCDDPVLGSSNFEISPCN
jgi:hypothetical protein